MIDKPAFGSSGGVSRGGTRLMKQGQADPDGVEDDRSQDDDQGSVDQGG
jgi:hypothetical protein